jgi:hypothetical protein
MLKRSVLHLLGLLQVVVFLAAASKPALAYVDPGSGLLAFQVGGSMVAGALFVLRAKIRKLFRRAGNKNEVASQGSVGTASGSRG